MFCLRAQVAILALIDLIWSRPADGRTLSFADIAAATHRAPGAVELLVMRALALKLVQGEIDQVRGVFLVSGVSARILSLDQIGAMQQRVKQWTEHVQSTLVTVEGAF